MLRLAIAFGVTLGCLAPVQAEEPASPYAHLKVLEPFLGPWVHEGPAQEAIPGFVEKGEQIRVPFTYKWVLDKSALVMNWSIEVKGKTSLDGMVLIGWDSKEKQIVARSFTTVGTTANDVWIVEGKTLRIKSHDVQADGTETFSTVFNKLTDRGTMIWQATDQVRDGKEIPDTPEYEFKPQK